MASKAERCFDWRTAMSSAAIEEDKMANLWTTIRWEEWGGGEEKGKERKDVSVVENNNKKKN